MEPLTLDQALINIQISIDKYVGTKAEHIALDQSINIIKETLKIQQTTEKTK